MKYITSIKVSMPAKTNLDKTKDEFSFLGKPKDYYKEIYEYNGFKIENAFNDKIFLEEFNQTVSLKLDLFFLDCAFVSAVIQIDSKTTLDCELLNNKEFYFKERKELSKIKINSISDILGKLILSKYYNLESFANILDDIDLDMNHAERWNNFIQYATDNTCIISNRYNFTISSSSGAWYIEEEQADSVELLVNQKKLKVWRKEDVFYFKGELDTLINIWIHEQVVQSKLNDGIHVFEIALNQINAKAKEILKKLTNTNPAYWTDLSIAIESEQLYFIEVQTLVYSTIQNFRNSEYLKYKLDEKRYRELKEIFDRKIEFIYQLSSEVNSALQNVSTPIKSKNDFKLQESTDKVNERILFLSFVAMCVPLISWVTSTEISTNIKLISGFVILLLPIFYFIINNLYHKRLVRKNKLNVFKDELKEQYKNIEYQQKFIKKLKSDDKEDVYAIQISACESNIKIHEKHIKKLEKKIKTI